MLHGPDFICIGPKKTATTWLADQLKLQRDVWLPPIQELSALTGEFSRHVGKREMRLGWGKWEVMKRIIRNKSLSSGADRRFLRAAQDLAQAPTVDIDLYRQLFAPARDRITGDISPMYASMTRDQIDHARPVLDRAALFMIARDPIARFWSELAMHASRKRFGSIDYSSLDCARMFFQDSERQHQHLLSDITGRWWKAYGRDRVRVFYFDDIASDADRSLREITAYIGADYAKRLPLVSPGHNRKRAGYRLVPSPEAREWVRVAFQEELRTCADLLGEPAKKWMRNHATA